MNKDKLFTPEFSVEKMEQVIKNLTFEDSGNIFDWSGISLILKKMDIVLLHRNLN